MDLQQFLGRFKTMVAALTRTQQITIGATFVAVTGFIAVSGYWMQSPNYRLLLADMDPEAASEVITRLRDANVPYVLDEGGRSVRVPAERVDELRLEFAGRGLPASGRIGFEIFDQTSFGATEFLEQVNYRRALEGEIARTIATLSEVSSARVHITMAKNSLFGSQAQPAKASVVLKLRRQRPLAASTVTAVASLVSASVEGLQPEGVVILDSFGRPLARPSDNGEEPTDAAQLDRQQRLERDMTERLTALLEPVAGIGRVRVNVSLSLTRQSEEETEERWDPNTAVIRSRQTTAATDAAGSGPGRVAGARANLPPNGATIAGGAPAQTAAVAAAPAAPAIPPAGRSGETTNYEISKTVRHSVRPRGDIRRLSVAVVLDDERAIETTSEGTTKRTSRPRQREEIQRIQGLVMAAAGIDLNRGDRVTVENIAFEETEVEEPDTGFWSAPTWV
ncbi:MAG TPA: flagellar basal-body MS-ring/collar protein FliF, partial [Vicinamibacterales bacterium]|nr:flagellar basal-body MS-ring/collar protein FliF [Vicinamibacterales bacterium]